MYKPCNAVQLFNGDLGRCLEGSVASDSRLVIVLVPCDVSRAQLSQLPPFFDRVRTGNMLGMIRGPVLWVLYPPQ